MNKRNYHEENAVADFTKRTQNEANCGEGFSIRVICIIRDNPRFRQLRAVVMHESIAKEKRKSVKFCKLLSNRSYAVERSTVRSRDQGSEYRLRLESSLLPVFT